MTDTTNSGAPTLDATGHRRDADYARELLAKLKAAGLSDVAIGKRVGVSDRTLREYKTGDKTMSYVVQYALESLLTQSTSDPMNTGHAVHEFAAPYAARPATSTAWHTIEERPLKTADAGKIVVGKDRFGAAVLGTLIKDGHGLVIREMHPQPVDSHSVPIARVAVYTLLDPMPK